MTFRFPKDVSRQLGHYVYRLVDPRTGLTFYVGRGQGDRVFSHAAGEIYRSAELQDPKLATIWDIKNRGLEVQHVIHRHGLSEEMAKEVEAALIDAYFGLHNKVKGIDRTRGVMHALEAIQRYQQEEARFLHPLVLIKVNRSIKEPGRSLRDAVRYAWRVSPTRANTFRYALAVSQGLIAGVFQVEGEWKLFTEANFPDVERARGRDDRTAPRLYGFNDVDAPTEVVKAYLHKRVPSNYVRGQASVRYVDRPEHERVRPEAA